MANRKRAIAELTADDRAFQRGMKRAEKRVSSLSKMSSRAFKSFGSVAGGVAEGAATAAIGGTAAVVVNEAKKALDFEGALTRLGINSAGAVGDLDVLLDRIFEISGATGVAREDILRAASSFVALTGDGKGAVEALGLFSKVAKGTGASIDDVATAAAAMQQNLRINPAELEKAFSILIRGGKAGAIELKDVAGLMASLAPLAATFKGGMGAEGLADMAAALQLARQGFGSASEAATGLEALMGSIVRHAEDFKDGGIKVFNTDRNGKKSLKSFQEIIEAIGQSRLARNPTALVKAFGSKEAYQTYLQLVKVKGAWTSLSDETLKANDVNEDFAEFSVSRSGRIEAGWNRVKNAVAKAMTTEMIEANVEFLELMIGKIGELDGAWDRAFHDDNSMFSGDAFTKANGGQEVVVPLKREDPGWFDLAGMGRTLAFRNNDIFTDELNTDLHRSAKETARQRQLDIANTALPFDMEADAAAGTGKPFDMRRDVPKEVKVKVDLQVKPAEGFDVRLANERGHALR